MSLRLMVNDPAGKRTVPIDKPKLTIGRRNECDIRMTGTHVSRLHAELTLIDHVCTIRDMGSSFGTFVNGERTTERVLVNGDRVRLGESPDTELVFMSSMEDDTSLARSSAAAAASELRHMAGLLEGLRALGSGRVLEDVLAIVLDSAIEISGAERGFVMLATADGELEFKLARIRGRMSMSGKRFETSRKIPEKVFQTGQDMIVEDLQDGDLADSHGGTIALGIRHVLCSPLRLIRYVDRSDQPAENKIIGVMYLDSRKRGALQSPEARSALDTLCAEAAIAIENARLYREALENAKLEQEMRVAAGIQAALLPPATRSGAFFSGAAKSVACRRVGGDFFDYTDVPDGGVGWILGDVSGKGPPAALLASAAMGMFGAEAANHTGAATVVSRMNRGIVRRGIEGRFITAFYGVLAQDGHFTYSNAGHNPPVVVGRTGHRRLETGGLVLGMFDFATFDEETITLEPGDLVVAFSDGVTEALNVAGEEYGDARLIDVLGKHASAEPQDVVDRVIADVRAFAGEATQSDDITLVVIKYTGAA